MASDTPARPPRPDPNPVDLETALSNAEQFLTKTGTAVHPDLSPRAMLRYLDQYRAHLYSLVASTRREQGRPIGREAT